MPHSRTDSSSFLSLKRYEEYYLSGGDLFFLVEHHVFRVHRYFFERESSYFRAKLATPASPGAVRQGTNETNAIVLEDVGVGEFARFLWVFYNPKFSLYSASVQDWSAILSLAHKWSFPEVKALAVRELEQLDMPHLDRIVVYHTNNVDRNLLIPRYAALCEREEPLTIEEGIRLGLETTIMLMRAREYARVDPADNGLRSPIRSNARGPDLHKIVRELFGIPEPEPDVALASPSGQPHPLSTSTALPSTAAQSTGPPPTTPPRPTEPQPPTAPQPPPTEPHPTVPPSTNSKPTAPRPGQSPPTPPQEPNPPPPPPPPPQKQQPQRPQVQTGQPKGPVQGLQAEDKAKDKSQGDQSRPQTPVPETPTATTKKLTAAQKKAAAKKLKAEEMAGSPAPNKEDNSGKQETPKVVDDAGKGGAKDVKEGEKEGEKGKEGAKASDVSENPAADEKTNPVANGSDKTKELPKFQSIFRAVDTSNNEFLKSPQEKASSSGSIFSIFQ